MHLETQHPCLDLALNQDKPAVEAYFLVLASLLGVCSQLHSKTLSSVRHLVVPQEALWAFSSSQQRPLVNSKPRRAINHRRAYFLNKHNLSKINSKCQVLDKVHHYNSRRWLQLPSLLRSVTPSSPSHS